MELLQPYLREEHPDIMETNIRLDSIGDLDRLPTIVRKARLSLIQISAQNHEMVLCLALSYSSHRDILWGKACEQVVDSGWTTPGSLGIPTKVCGKGCVLKNTP